MTSVFVLAMANFYYNDEYYSIRGCCLPELACRTREEAEAKKLEACANFFKGKHQSPADALQTLYEYYDFYNDDYDQEKTKRVQKLFGGTPMRMDDGAMVPVFSSFIRQSLTEETFVILADWLNLFHIVELKMVR